MISRIISNKTHNYIAWFISDYIFLIFIYCGRVCSWCLQDITSLYFANIKSKRGQEREEERKRERDVHLCCWQLTGPWIIWDVYIIMQQDGFLHFNWPEWTMKCKVSTIGFLSKFCLYRFLQVWLIKMLKCFLRSNDCYYEIQWFQSVFLHWRLLV